MADFLLYLSDANSGNRTGEFRPENLSFSIRNSEPGSVNFEIPLSEPFLQHQQFGPYRTDYHIYRAGQSQNYTLLVEGIVTSVNLNNDRDTVLLAGKDWLHYLERRVYPFNPRTYILGAWDQWPHGWPHHPGSFREKQGDPVEVREIVEDILERMQAVELTGAPSIPAAGGGHGQLNIMFNNVNTGRETKYKIYPNDSTTIFDHIRRLSEQVEGFEFDILPQSREFKMWSPDRLDTSQPPVYSFKVQDTEAFGAVTNIDWTNDGPDGTFLVGVGTSKVKAGAVWYYERSVDKYRWLDQFYDFGTMENTDLILNMLKDQNDLHPQRKLALTILNPEFLSPSFYTGGRPRGLIGRMVNVQHTFPPYWTINSMYRVNAINWTVDQSSNEEVELELEIIPEPEDESGERGGV